MKDKRWLKLMATGSAVDTVINLEVYPADQPPAPMERPVGFGTYYRLGETDDGEHLPVGPGFAMCGDGYYAAAGNLVWAPDGSAAAATLTDQIASLA